MFAIVLHLHIICCICRINLGFGHFRVRLAIGIDDVDDLLRRVEDNHLGRAGRL